MTFENEEGYNRALKYNETVQMKEYAHLKKWLDTHEILIEDAPEPSDIIWENRHFTKWHQTKMKFVVYGTLTILLLLSFLFIFIMSSISQTLLKKYPYKTEKDCQNLIGYGDDNLMQTLAVHEYTTNYNLELMDNDVSYAGYVQCFCDQKALDGDASDTLYGADDTLVC